MKMTSQISIASFFSLQFALNFSFLIFNYYYNIGSSSFFFSFCPSERRTIESGRRVEGTGGTGEDEKNIIVPSIVFIFFPQKVKFEDF